MIKKVFRVSFIYCGAKEKLFNLSADLKANPVQSHGQQIFVTVYTVSESFKKHSECLDSFWTKF